MTTTASEPADQRDALLSFRCPPPLIEAADKAATQELMSRSAFARRALLVAVRTAGIEVDAEPMAAGSP
jgi:hypothetical protein